MSDRFLVYLCKECGKPPKQKIFHSMPSVGGEYKNMYDLLMTKYEKVDTTAGSKELACSAGVCEVVDIEAT